MCGEGGRECVVRGEGVRGRGVRGRGVRGRECVVRVGGSEGGRVCGEGGSV